ncbi:MAG: chromosome partitioning protein [Solirubrobacterales bacterium]|nr:chromosome partitioning protein [Solirubrobacterales bacterium]
MNEPNETTLADYLRVMRQRRVFILMVAVGCAVAAFGASSLQTPSYSATSSVTVRDLSQDLTPIGGAFPGSQTQLQLASIHLPLVTREEVVQRVRGDLGSPLDLDALRKRVDVEIDPNSIVVKITSHARHGDEAAAIANAFAKADASLSTREARHAYAVQAEKVQQKLRRLKPPAKGSLIDKDAIQRAALQDQLTRLQSLSAVARPVEVSDVARVPGAPSSPKPVRNTIGALIFGLLLGIALAYTRASLDHRLRVTSEVEQAFDNKPIVGHIRSQALGHAGATTDARDKKSPGPLSEPDEESFRILRHNVRYLSAEENLRTVLVTSAMAQEGKSTVSACLAMANAAAGKRTLLIECDLRRPVLATRFGLAEKPGLTDYLTGHAEPQDIMQTVAAIPSEENTGGTAATLVCITSGSAPPRPADLLGSERFRTFLAEVSEVYDTIIIDSAPLLSVADTLELIPHVSAVLVCVRLQQSTRDQARAAQAALARLPERPTGIVLTDVKDTGEGYYGYYAAPVAAAKA